jgi:inner membrane transporter RhtA
MWPVATPPAVRPRRPAAVPGRFLAGPPQLLFVTGAVSQYVGSALAVLLFDRVDAAGVAWLRVLSAAVALAVWRRPWRARWSRSALALVAAFGLVLAAMNTCFYLAIARLPLGTAVAIEFLGPIVVAAVGSRTRRDFTALALAALGVALLADVRFSGSPLGVVLAFAAGMLWAGYIVIGHRVARAPGLGNQTGLAAGMMCGAVGFAFLAPIAAPAFSDVGLLAACLGVGLLSSVVPYGIEQVAMRRLPRARFALLLSLLPATAAVVGFVVLGQVPHVAEAVGIGLVVMASALRSHAD